MFNLHPEYIADGFDYPVGKPNATGYYNAQKFMENKHLGDDWNGRGGGNTDLGDPIYSIGSGYVVSAMDEGGGWGNVVRIIHQMPEGSTYEFVESLYAHLDSVGVYQGQLIKRGDFVGTIGNVRGIYWAHLHLELRHTVDMELGGGYDTDTTGFLDPTQFIRAHRPQ